MVEREWNLKRNCSLTPRQFGLAYAAPCMVGFGIALLLSVLNGTWLLLGFALLEAVGAAVAFVLHARHASDRERLTLSEASLLVDRSLGGELECMRLDRYRTRVTAPCCPRGLIRLEAPRMQIEIGRFVPAARRGQLASELRAALRSPGERH